MHPMRRQTRRTASPDAINPRIRRAGIAALFLLACASATAQAAPSAELLYLREHYTKYEYDIPMRDGVHLFTTVYVPKDNTKRYPILLTRTPYSLKPYGEDIAPAAHG